MCANKPSSALIQRIKTAKIEAAKKVIVVPRKQPTLAELIERLA